MWTPVKFGCWVWGWESWREPFVEMGELEGPDGVRSLVVLRVHLWYRGTSLIRNTHAPRTLICS